LATGTQEVIGSLATASLYTGGSANDSLTGGTGADTIIGGAGNDTIVTGVDTANGNSVTGGLGADAITIGNVTVANVTYGLNVTAAESFATAGRFDTVTTSNLDAGDESLITLTTGVLTSTLTMATSVNVGTTTVTAGAFLVVRASGVAGAGTSDISVYQDSNSNGIIETTDLQVNFTKNADDTFAVSIVANKLLVDANGL
jgi:hypothetical protein